MEGSLYVGSGGYLSYRVAGHGIKYYSHTEKRSSEMLANWGALKMMDSGLAKRFSQECPEVAKALDGVLEKLMTKSKA